jgi:hypothetical protein
MLEGFLQFYRGFRRRTFPPSIADVEWRHDFLAARLDEIQKEMNALVVMNRAPTAAQQEEMLAILRLLEPRRVVGYEKTRVGSPGDGGYVQIDDLKGVTRAFSFGVADNDSWDLAMAQAGVPVEQFDHSIDHAPSTHPLLKFHRKMIAAKAAPGAATLGEIVAACSKSNEPDLILKIDIEGYEWEVFDGAAEADLDRFTQILCEFHDLARLDHPEFRVRAHRALSKLTALFAPVHVHANNHRRICNVGNIPVPDVLEISFASRRRYTFADSNEVFPTPLDAPNCPHIADIRLGTFRF